MRKLIVQSQKLNQLFAARRAYGNAACTYTPMSQPIGKGNVVPAIADGPKPHYAPQPYLTWASTLYFAFQWGQLNQYIFSFVMVFGVWGGFAGYLPPDPHALFP